MEKKVSSGLQRPSQIGGGLKSKLKAPAAPVAQKQEDQPFG
jgi:hypothetical protein